MRKLQSANSSQLKTKRKISKKWLLISIAILSLVITFLAIPFFAVKISTEKVESYRVSYLALEDGKGVSFGNEFTHPNDIDSISQILQTYQMKGIPFYGRSVLTEEKDPNLISQSIYIYVNYENGKTTIFQLLKNGHGFNYNRRMMIDYSEKVATEFFEKLEKFAKMTKEN